MRPAPLVFALLLATCSVACDAALSGPAQAPVADLRTHRLGVCAKSFLNGSMAAVALNQTWRYIQTCVVTGHPGTLQDDGKTPYVVTTVWGDANAPNARTANWQVEAWLDGAPMGKRMLGDSGAPELSCGATTGGAVCDSWSLDVMEWQSPFRPGVYTFRYTYALNVAETAVNTIRLTPY